MIFRHPNPKNREKSMEYKVIKAERRKQSAEGSQNIIDTHLEDAIGELTDNVNEHIENKWKPQGGINIFIDDGYVIAIQAMTRESIYD
jgi:hypothetical protein